MSNLSKELAAVNFLSSKPSNKKSDYQLKTVNNSDLDDEFYEIVKVFGKAFKKVDKKKQHLLLDMFKTVISDYVYVKVEYEIENQIESQINKLFRSL